MIHIDVPGMTAMDIEHVLLDYNGTIAKDGALVPEGARIIGQLARLAHVVILTADTYGTVRGQCASLGVEVLTFPREDAAQFKEGYVRSLKGQVACLGNGRNDALMLDAATLSIAVIDAEGAWAGILSHADIVARSATEALELLLNPNRIRATLRS